MHGSAQRVTKTVCRLRTQLPTREPDDCALLLPRLALNCLASDLNVSVPLVKNPAQFRNCAFAESDRQLCSALSAPVVPHGETR